MSNDTFEQLRAGKVLTARSGAATITHVAVQAAGLSDTTATYSGPGSDPGAVT